MERNAITELVDTLVIRGCYSSQAQAMQALKEKPQQYREWGRGNQPRDTAIFKLAEDLGVKPEEILIIVKQYDKRGTEETKRYWRKKATPIMDKIRKGDVKKGW